MNERQQEILRMLASRHHEYVLIKEFSEELHCSEKTVRNDLKVIQESMAAYPSVKLIRKPGQGICLEIGEQDRAELYRELQTRGSSHVEEEDRIVQIAYFLLMNTDPVVVQDLVDRYYVSKSVIRKDLERIGDWFKRFDLELLSKQKVGLTIEGTELNRRLALTRLSQLVDDGSDSFISAQFTQHEITIVRRRLEELQERFDLHLTDETFERIVVHTLLMIKRTKLQQTISLSEKEKTMIMEKKEYEWTVAFLEGIEPYFSVRFPEAEQAYLALHFLGGKFRYQDDEAIRELTGHDNRLGEVTDLLLGKLSEMHGVDFYSDPELFNGLTVHLNSTLNRLTYGLPVTNVMLGDIKRMYPFMFDRIMLVLEELEGIEVPEEEAAYITLHFQASLERLQQPITDVKRVVIVCHMGMGMSQLLRTKIERKFSSVLVLASIGKGELQSFLETSETDLIISTISLPDMGVPTIVVSPLLGKQDEERLKERLTYLEDPVQRGERESIILKFANPFLVFPQQEGFSRYELIRKLAGTLVDKGFADHAYIENAMIRERMSATTIGAGIAIPHGHPDLIHQSAIAIATLREPIEWGEEKVSLVFLLAVKSTDPAESRQLFQEISHLTENPERIEQLLSDRDAMTFLTHLGAV